MLKPANAASSAAPLIFDSLILGIIVYQTYRHALEMRKYGQSSITEVVLRDGVSPTFVLGDFSSAE